MRHWRRKLFTSTAPHTSSMHSSQMTTQSSRRQNQARSGEHRSNSAFPWNLKRSPLARSYPSEKEDDLQKEGTGRGNRGNKGYRTRHSANEVYLTASEYEETDEERRAAENSDKEVSAAQSWNARSITSRDYHNGQLYESDRHRNGGRQGRSVSFYAALETIFGRMPEDAYSISSSWEFNQ